MCMWQSSKYLKGQRGTFLVAVTLQSMFIHCNSGDWMLCLKSCLIMFNQEEEMVLVLLIFTSQRSWPSSLPRN